MRAAAAIAWLLLGACAADGAPAAGPDAEAGLPPTRIYATIVSHNDDWPANDPCDAMANGGRYPANRRAVVEFAEMVIAHDAAYDFQTARAYLELIEGESAELRAETGGLSLARHLAERSPEHLVVDARAHERPSDDYNGADVAGQLAGLGVAPTGVVGGYLMCPADQENWTQYWNPPIAGRNDPTVSWSPTTLWGGGSPNHVCDSRLSGVWRPASDEQHGVDDPSRTLINIGNGPGVDEPLGNVGSTYAIDTMLAALRDGELEEHRMYTATLMTAQCDFDLADSPSNPARIAELLDQLAPEVEAGHLVWATLPEIARIWRDEYAMAPSVY